jgi:hypothetical protein
MAPLRANTLTTDAHTYSMNKFDPTFITLAHGGSVTQAYIGEMNTNLVLKMSFDFYSALRWIGICPL